MPPRTTIDLRLSGRAAPELHPAQPDLPERCVHLWVADLQRLEIQFLVSAATEIEFLFWRFLSTAEQERAERFHFDIDRRRFVIRRGLLRILLGAYLHLPPDQVVYLANAFGKPALDGLALPTTPLASKLRFNLSHSAGAALFAFALHQEVGVDIEQVRQDFEFLPIARRFFSPAEQQTLLALPPEQHPQAFFNCWTRKEAYIKAQGQGLSLPLDQFDVSLAPGEPAQLLAARHQGAGPANEWRMFHLEPAPGYTGALAIQGRDWQLQIFAVNFSDPTIIGGIRGF